MDTVTKQKPTPLQMAEQAMQDMKTRIDLLRSHKSNVNRLVQTVSGPNKPVFLIREIETEEALLRHARTELNLWMQALNSGGTYVDEEAVPVFRASQAAESLISVQRKDDSDIVEFPLAHLQFVSDFDGETMREILSNLLTVELSTRQLSTYTLGYLREALENCPDELFDTLVSLYKEAQRIHAGEDVLVETAIPNV